MLKIQTTLKLTSGRNILYYPKNELSFRIIGTLVDEGILPTGIKLMQDINWGPQYNGCENAQITGELFKRFLKSLQESNNTFTLTGKNFDPDNISNASLITLSSYPTKRNDYSEINFTGHYSEYQNGAQTFQCTLDAQAKTLFLKFLLEQTPSI